MLKHLIPKHKHNNLNQKNKKKDDIPCILLVHNKELNCIWREYNIYIFRISNKQPKLHIYIHKQRYTTLHIQDEVTNSTNIIDNNIYKY